MNASVLVGDIGSTKSTWWYGADQPVMLQLRGYNPVSHATAVGDELFSQLHNQSGHVFFDSIWYYGAGVIDSGTADKIRTGLHVYFPNSEIHIQSDLEGACVAACGISKGTVAILGTGSHAANWDGKNITQKANALGYILGDEGGGCDIGKCMIQAYFYNEMPEPIRSVMAERLDDDRSKFLIALQKNEAPNQFLADFAKVAVQFSDHPWIDSVISPRIELFIKRHLLPLKPEREINIVGSIGCIFASLINRELGKYGLTVGTCITDPAQRLFERHLEHGKK